MIGEEYKEIREFSENFAHNFISGMWCEKEFKMLTGKDMQEIFVKLRNCLCIELDNYLTRKEAHNERQ